MSENNRFSGRIKRYARVGASVGGVAVKVAGDRIFGGDRSARARELRSRPGRTQGPVMKVAQILATVPDALPDDYIKELAQLQSNAPPMGWAFVNRRMGAELGKDWQGRYGHFEHRAASAASWAKSTKRSARRRGACLQATIPGHGFGRGGRSEAVESRLFALPALRQGHRFQRDSQGNLRPRPRGWIMSARPPT